MSRTKIQGNYKVYLFDNSRGNDVGIRSTRTHKDPVLKAIFDDVRFRQALSLAINRQQVNDVLYFGKATVRQATIPGFGVVLRRLDGPALCRVRYR